jgi:hypothetical protein
MLFPRVRRFKNGPGRSGEIRNCYDEIASQLQVGLLRGFTTAILRMGANV